MDTDANVRHIVGWRDVFRLIKEDSSINFIAVAISPWHALSVDATIAYMQAQGITLRGVICCAEHYDTGWAIDESYFLAKCCKKYSIPAHHEPFAKYDSKWDRQINNLQEYKYVLWDWMNWQNKPLLYYICPNRPDFQLLMQMKMAGRYVQCIAYDEGVATYMTTLQPKPNPIKSIRDLWLRRHYIRQHIFGNKVRSFLHKDKNTFLFNRTSKGLEVNDYILPYYREIFSQRYAMLYGKKVLDISHAIVICTTAWQRDKIKNNEDLKVLIRVCKKLRNEGYRLFLKTHPRDVFFTEHAKEIGAEVLDVPEMSMELLCVKTQPLAIIGYSSTTLVVPYVFWKIPGICLTNLLKRDNLGESYREEIDSFKSVFSNVVTYVNNDVQLCDFLEGVKNENV